MPNNQPLTSDELLRVNGFLARIGITRARLLIAYRNGNRGAALATLRRAALPLVGLTDAARLLLESLE